MSLTKEEEEEARKQLREQVSQMPADKRAEAEKMITEMTSQAIEDMVMQQRARGAIFRKIANKEIKSYLVGETDEAIAVLEIRPLSKGHTLIVPKKVAKSKSDITEKTLEFSKKIAEKIQDTLKPKKVHVKSEPKLGEVIIEIIPEYDKAINEEEDEREMADQKDLESTLGEMQKEVIKLTTKKDEPTKEKDTKQVGEVLKVEPVKLKRRIP